MPAYSAIELAPVDNPSRLSFRTDPELNGTLTPEQHDLRHEIQTIEHLLRTQFSLSQARTTLFEQLRDIAKVGLVGLNSNPQEARRELNGFQGEVTNSAREIRSQYLTQLRTSSIIVLIAGITVAILAMAADENITYFYEKITSLSDKRIEQVVDGVSGFGFSLIGLAVGTLFFAHLSNRIITFSSIKYIKRYSYSPWRYYFYLTLLTLVAYIAILLNLIWIGIGGVNLNAVSEHPVLGAVIGFICGFAETKMANLLGTNLNPTTSSEKSD
jgi:hypothetical protein